MAEDGVLAVMQGYCTRHLGCKTKAGALAVVWGYIHTRHLRSEDNGQHRGVSHGAELYPYSPPGAEKASEAGVLAVMQGFCIRHRRSEDNGRGRGVSPIVVNDLS